ncbi:MAG: hypothetical protein A4E20_01450 [Nitrospira sp. SG-bin2]|uniref:hypothetical protein n=1 Tax=Nitrospira cf. moscoviensis SBR1015 TaxID=96242 RepID=UPI000A0C4D73|nr:hypothetical protein [Nitrospira cf. moscoviensis SBR1015]OQW34870.1 MAG: hypothetical protein A4E20_01450 [Nitrospira sp. SG-bin2]
MAISGLTPEERLPEVRLYPGILCTILDNADLPAGMFGVVPTDDLAGAVWLLGSEALVRDPLRRQFIREGRSWLDRLHAFRPLLHNVVDERNTLHVHWLKKLGFVFIKRHPAYGYEQRPFLEFVRLRHV